MSRIALSLCICAALPLAACQSGNSPSAAREVDAAKAAYFASWTKAENKPWTSDKLKAACAATPEFLSIDGMVPPPPAGPGAVIDGFAAFDQIWSGLGGMNQFSKAELKENKTLRTWVSGDTAATVSSVRVMGTMPNGTALDMPANVTLVFRKSEGKWRIVHENMNMAK